MQSHQRARLVRIKHALVESCEVCGGMGYVLDEEGESTMCSCMITFRWLMAVVLARLPAATWSLNPLGEVRSAASAVEVIKRMLTSWQGVLDTGIGVAFFGPNGTGKTTLACEVAKFALASGQKAGYLTANEYISAQKPGSPLGWMMDWLRGLEVIVLDELDKPYAKEGSSYVASQMDTLLREAAIGGQVLITASNAVVDDLRLRYGNSLVSALERACVFVAVGGDDLSTSVQQDHYSRIARGMSYDDPHLQRWAQLYYAKTYSKTKEIT